jgi:(2Fe-2S) ferredoxin
MPSFSRHVFVCTNERSGDDPRGSCQVRGGAEVRDRLKSELKKHRVLKSIRVNNAGCLDQCQSGVAIVVYPEQVWYQHVTADDVPELVENHLIGGQPVERLLMPDQPHLRDRQSLPVLAAAAISH